MFVIYVLKYILFILAVLSHSQHSKMKITLKKKSSWACLLVGGFVGFAWISSGTFQHFFSFLFIFVSVVFSVLQCITWHYPSKFELQRISWKQFGPERSCQADKTFLLSFTLKCSFFSTSKIHKAAKLLTCVRGAARLLHSFMPHYAKLHIVYLKNTEHFSTIKKHVI